MTPQSLFDGALSRVESASIRAWAQTSHNQPIWLQLAASALAKAAQTGSAPDPSRFAAFIVASAIGL